MPRILLIMNKFVFTLICSIFFGLSFSQAQSYAVFSEKPKMQLTPKNEYQHCKIRYRTNQKSTIYLELKNGNEIVASGVYDVDKPSENVVLIPLITKQIRRLSPGKNYSYNLYMYNGGRNDWTKKACRSAHINKVQMVGNPNATPRKKENMTSSFRNFFK